MEGGETVGCRSGDNTLKFKADGYGRPTATPNRRIILPLGNAQETELPMRARRHHQRPGGAARRHPGGRLPR